LKRKVLTTPRGRGKGEEKLVERRRKNYSNKNREGGGAKIKQSEMTSS
jgi:hypothetical protein